MTQPSGALSTSFQDHNWIKIEKHVKRLQMRIAKATKDKRYGKVKSLQWLLTHSWAAKMLAVKRVCSNKGKRTPGVDGKLWNTSKQKHRAVLSLKRYGYKAQPLRRVCIPKKNGKTRLLGIPTMRDRAFQALYLLSIEPVSETTADKHSYGFRINRSCADAVEQIHTCLGWKRSAQWVLEADIKGCFDNISHEYLIKNILCDKSILKQWLKAGYIENRSWNPSEAGTPQGGIISPTLANMVMDGLEKEVKSLALQSDKVNVIRYADDFIITGSTQEILLNVIKPKVSEFLAKRGLFLSEEKTKVTHIEEGFDFLGFNFRKFEDKLIVKPSKNSIKNVSHKIRDTIKRAVSWETHILISRLNPIIVGWCNYYKHVCSKQAFGYLDHVIFQSLWKWAKRRHPNKNTQWRIDKYFHCIKGRNWVFATKRKKDCTLWQQIALAKHIPIKRHIKIRSNANPFLPEWKEYYIQRRSNKVRNAAGSFSTRKILEEA